MTTAAIRKALEFLENISMSPDEWEIYETRLKWLRDEKMTIKTAENKGKKIRELEIARNMKLAGMTMGVIKQMIGLSEDDINKL